MRPLLAAVAAAGVIALVWLPLSEAGASGRPLPRRILPAEVDRVFHPGQGILLGRFAVLQNLADPLPDPAVAEYAVYGAPSIAYFESHLPRSVAELSVLPSIAAAEKSVRRMQAGGSCSAYSPKVVHGHPRRSPQAASHDYCDHVRVKNVLLIFDSGLRKQERPMIVGLMRQFGTVTSS